MPEYKTPEYTRRAIAKYLEKKRNEEDYKEKRREYSRNYYLRKKERELNEREDSL